jgi:hypothetical protein
MNVRYAIGPDGLGSPRCGSMLKGQRRTSLIAERASDDTV